MFKAKRLLATVLACAMASTLFACSGDGASSSGTGGTTSSGSSTGSDAGSSGGEVEKPEEIFLMVDVSIDDAGKLEDGRTVTDAVWDYYEEQTGITVRVLKPPHNEYPNKLELQFRSNDVPDMVEVPADKYLGFASQGAFHPLRSYIENSEVFKNADQSLIEAMDYKGEIYGIQKEIGNGNVTYVRKDWLDALGMEVPTTWDEFIEMLRRFRDEDPDGNGQDDTVPYISAKFENYSYMVDWLQDAEYDFYKNADGQWVDGFSEPAMVEALQRLSDAYQEGLIEPEIFNLSTTDARNKFYTGNVGCFTYWAGSWNENINRELQKNIPTASVVPIPPLADYKFVNRVAPSWCLPVMGNAKNPEGVFKYLIEYMYDGGEGQTWATYGVEGVTYEYQDGVMVPLPSPLEPDVQKKTPSKTLIEPGLNYVPFDDPFVLPEAQQASNDLFMANMEQAVLVPATKTYLQNSGEFTRMRQEYIAKAMKGEMTPEEAIEAYKAEAEQFGVSTILEEMNAEFGGN